MFDPDGPEAGAIFDDDFVEMFGRWRWQGFRLVRWITDLRQGRYTGPPTRVGQVVAVVFAAFTVILIGGWAIELSWYCIAGSIGLAALVWYMINSKFPLGILSTKQFEDWLDKKLRTKLGNVDAADRVRFRHFDIPLKIIATDVISRKPIVLERKDYPDVEVAKAVRCSMAIPGVFNPLIEGNMLLVDGGVLSNFPAWVFDEERSASGEIISTIGFRLQTPKRVPTTRKRSLVQFAFDLGRVFFGDNPLQIRAIEDLHLIGIKVTPRTLDFDMKRDGRIHLFNEGYIAATKYFRDDFIGPKNAEEIKQLLRQIHDDISGNLSIGDPYLRVNIAVPIECARDTLRILYSYHMDDDADDNLRLKIGSGAIGECWVSNALFLVNMMKARKVGQSAGKWTNTSRPKFARNFSLPGAYRSRQRAGSRGIPSSVCCRSTAITIW